MGEKGSKGPERLQTRQGRVTRRRCAGAQREMRREKRPGAEPAFRLGDIHVDPETQQRYRKGRAREHTA